MSNISFSQTRYLRISKRKTLSAMIVVAFLIINLIFFFKNNNPDWEGYKSIFDDGAWLKSQGRDLGFTSLGDAVKAIGGSYLDFRIYLCIYFTLFTSAILWLWRNEASKPSYLWTFAGLLPLLLPRFTVQVREGVALTLILAAYTLLMSAKTQKKSFLFALPPLTLSILAPYLIHSGLALFPILFFISIAITFIETKFKQAPGSLQKKFNALTLILVCATLASGKIAEKINSFAPDLYEGFISRETDFGLEKIIFWTMKSLLLIYLIRITNNAIQEKKWPPIFSNLLSLSANSALPAIHLLILYLIFTNSLAIVTSSVNRLYSSILFVTLAVSSLRSKKTGILSISIILQLLDQYRVILTNAPD